MPPHVHAAHETWSLLGPVTITLVIAAGIYFRGWFHLHRVFPNPIPGWRVAVFVSGLLSLWIPLASPLRALDHELLTMHMVKHILLMAIAPPLLLLGAPVLAFLDGLPQRVVRGRLCSFLGRPRAQKLGHVLTHPVLAWLGAAITLLVWHLPTVFQLGMRSQSWHDVQHVSFFVSGFLFWWPVVQPWPSIARAPGWHIPLYLFLATLPCDALSAFLVFCDRVVYSSYLTAPRLVNISALQDQECAGALMWVCATFIYLIPAVLITTQLLSPSSAHAAEQTQAESHRTGSRRLPAGAEVA